MPHRRGSQGDPPNQALLGAGKSDQVADRLRSMKRLWKPGAQQGVIDRREREAVLWTQGFAALRLD